MKALLIAIAFVTLGLSTLAQTTTEPCDFLKNLKFKNGRDTIVVKAVLRDFLLAPPRLLLKRPPSIYKYKFGTYVLFQPENCNHNYEEPVISSRWVDPENILNGDNLGLTVYLTCVVFNESILNKGEPDCLVIKVKSAIHSQIAFPKRCNFLPDLHFNNGADTVVIAAKYHAIFGQNKGLILSDLNKKHLLNSKSYDKSIGFKVPGCDEDIIASYHFKTAAEEALLNKQPEESPIYLTCVVFQNYYSFGMPFFVIEKFKLAK